MVADAEDTWATVNIFYTIQGDTSASFTLLTISTIEVYVTALRGAGAVETSLSDRALSVPHTSLRKETEPRSTDRAQRAVLISFARDRQTAPPFTGSGRWTVRVVLTVLRDTLVVYTEGVGWAGDPTVITSGRSATSVYATLILKAVIIKPALRRKYTAVI